MEMQRPYRKFFIVSIVLHAIIFFILAAGFEFSGKNFVFEKSDSQAVINAVVMSSMQAPKPAKILTPPIQRSVPPPPAAKQPPRVIPVEKMQPKPDVIALNAKRKLQEDQIAKQLLADLNKQKIAQKQLKQKALEHAFEKEIKNLSAKSLKQELNSEKQRVGAEREQKAQGEVDKYKALVLQVIGQHWLIPSNVDKKLAVGIVIYLAPGGMVLDAEVYKSSGNVALDNSARAAVFKASPLPVPTDSEGFKFFKRFILVFRPIYFQQNGQTY